MDDILIDLIGGILEGFLGNFLKGLVKAIFLFPGALFLWLLLGNKTRPLKSFVNPKWFSGLITLSLYSFFSIVLALVI